MLYQFPPAMSFFPEPEERQQTVFLPAPNSAGTLEVRNTQEGCQIVRLISTNPAAYLRPELAPGSFLPGMQKNYSEQSSPEATQ